MQTESSIQALLAANLPKGTKLFLVAAIPVDDLASLGAVGFSKTAVAAESAIPSSAGQADQVDVGKRDRLIAALQKVEPNDTRAVIMKLLLTTAEGEWLAFPAMVAAIEKAGICKGQEASGRGQAALRDISWQIKQYMPATDLAGLTVAIDVLATRRRFGKETRYRLTQVGRAALAYIAKSN
jgi:hypothetical protein